MNKLFKFSFYKSTNFCIHSIAIWQNVLIHTSNCIVYFAPFSLKAKKYGLRTFINYMITIALQSLKCHKLRKTKKLSVAVITFSPLSETIARHDKNLIWLYILSSLFFLHFVCEPHSHHKAIIKILWILLIPLQYKMKNNVTEATFSKPIWRNKFSIN